MYEQPLIYDIAFGWRDFRAEVDLLVAWWARAAGLPAGATPEAAIELAAGPADHALEFAQRGVRAAALDLAPEMNEYAAKKAAARGVALETIRGDMTEFSVE